MIPLESIRYCRVLAGQREEDGRAREPILSLNPSILVTSQTLTRSPTPRAVAIVDPSILQTYAHVLSFSLEDYRLPAPTLIPSAVRHVLTTYPSTNRVS